jgi:hypothetical protein
MSGWPLKSQARVAGIDDGPYFRNSTETVVIITIMRLDGYIEGFLKTHVQTDGSDSSEKISSVLMESRFFDQIRAVISDGACLGGFNVLDLQDLNRKLEVPVVTCSDEAPNTRSIEEGLKNNFVNWRRKLDLITRWDPVELELNDGICYIRSEGIATERAKWIIRKATIRGRIPEPVRISHMIASTLYPKGEKNG